MTPTPPQRTGLQRLTGYIAGLLKPSPAQAAQAQRPSSGRRNYAAAQLTRLTDGWTTANLSANASIHASLDVLRARSRQLAQDNDYAKKFLSLVRTNVVGPDGMRLEARVYNAPQSPDTPANDAIESAWAKFAAKGVADITGRNSLRGICEMVINAAARDGEYLVRIIRGSEAGNAFGLALQVLDVDRLDTDFNRAATDTERAVRMGIELNKYGRPVAYHLRGAHPGDPYNASRAMTRISIPADEILHGFIADRPEQVRGVPWMHASMLRLNNLGGYEEAAVVASRVGASKMGFFTKSPDAPEVEGAGLGTEESDGGRLLMEADAGTFDTLPEGYGFTPFNPDYPSAMFGEFVKASLRGIASGLGVSYHSLANDLEGVSFSSIRSGTLEERDQWMLLQSWFVESFLEPLFAEWLRNALGFGLIVSANGRPLPLDKLDKFSAHAFQGRRWDWVDPLRDIQADITAMEAGLKAPQDITSKMGADYEDVLVKIKAAKELRDKLGITPPAPPAANPQPQAQGTTP